MDTPVPAAEALCSHLHALLLQGSISGCIHSVFDHTINISSPFGLIPLLSQGRGMVPYSVRLWGALPQGFQWRTCGLGVLLRESSIVPAVGWPPITLCGAAKIDLSLRPTPPCPPEILLRLAQQLRQFLLARGQEEGLSSLALWEEESPRHNAYARFLFPRLTALRTAIFQRDTQRSILAAQAFAGCGPGLTPSSDDFLCGYLSALYAARRLSPARLAAITQGAAERTGSISGDLLLRLGQGCVNEPVLALFTLLARGVLTHAALEQVAQIGSTSGGDLLTGIYWGLIDTAKEEKT